MFRNSYRLHRHRNYSTTHGHLSESEDIPPIKDDLDRRSLSYPEFDKSTIKFLVRQSQVLAKVMKTYHFPEAKVYQSQSWKSNTSDGHAVHKDLFALMSRRE